MSYFNDISFINATKRIDSCYTSILIQNTGYSLEYIGSGSIIFIKNKTRFRLVAPVVFWMLPGNSYQFLPDNDQPVEHFWVDFYGARAERMLTCLDERVPVSMISLVRPIEFEIIFEEMIKIYKEFAINKRYQAIVCLERLMGIIYSAFIETNTKKLRYDFIVDIADKIKLSPIIKYDFKKISKQNGISYDHFRVLFREYNHMSPYDYLLQCRMEYAAKILHGDEILIKDLASLCGFNEISSFSRMFKKRMGVSPAKYINMYKRK